MADGQHDQPAELHDSIEESATAARFLGIGYRRRMIAMMLVISVLNFADRSVFAALAQTIKADMGLTDLQLGLLEGILFAALYAAVGMPIGVLSDRHSRTRIVAIATTIWSAATIATGMANSFMHLAAARLVVGMGEAGFTPPVASIVSDITPRNRRASTMAIIMLGSPIGAFAGATLAGMIAVGWGWRTAFIVFGVPGFLAAILLLWLVPEPPRGLMEEGQARGAASPTVKEFLRELRGNRSLLLVIAGGSMTGFGSTAISQFLAVFLARAHHLDVREAAAAFGSVSGLSLATGLLVGSFGTDYLSKRDPRWPAWGAAIGLACAPPVYLAAFHASDLWTAIALLVVAGAFLMSFYGPTSGMIQNLLPARMRASGIALYTLLFTLIGSGLGPVFVGGASDWFAGRAYGLDYVLDCPNGLPPQGAGAALEQACLAASASGIQSALSLAVLALFISATLFVAASSGLRRPATST